MSNSSATTEVDLEGPRPARLDERDELIAMVNLIFRTAQDRQATIASDWVHVFAPENLANILVVRDGAQQKLVASTGVWVCDVRMGEAMVRVGGINCVGTLPEYRRHGLGSQVMVAAQERMRQLGCHVGLLGTGIMNWYRRLGWEEAGRTRSYRLNRGNIGLLPRLRPGLQLRIIKLRNNDGAETALDDRLLALYHQQQMGAPRTLEGFRQRVAARNYDQLVIAEEAGEPVAYLLLFNYEVMEWAGAVEDVVGLTHAAFDAWDSPQASTSLRSFDPGPVILRTLYFNAPGWQHPMTILLDRVGIPFNSQYLGMLYLMDPQGILDAYGMTDVRIAPVKGSKASDEIGEAIDTAHYLVRAGQDEVILDRRQLTKYLFGPERVSEIAADRFPLPFMQWYLEKV